MQTILRRASKIMKNGIKKNLMIRFFLSVVVLGIGGKSWGQTNPTAQSIPYSQNFGTTTFTTMPTGMAAWNTFGSNLTTQATAESSVPGANATVTAATATQTTGAVYGYAASSNARAYIQQSSNATNGTNQIVVAINTGAGVTSINVAYQLELINGGVTTQDYGLELQYRQGTSGTWTNVSGSAMTFGAVTTYTTQTLSYNITGLTASTDYQIRWIVWRPSGSGASKGIGVDNISVTAAAVPSIAISAAHPSAANILQGSTDNIVGGIQCDVTTANATLTGVTINTTGTYSAASDFTNFKFWLSSSASSISGATQLGAAQSSVASGGTVSVSGLSASITSGTTRYILVTASVSATATAGGTIRLGSTAFSNIVFSSGVKTGTDPVSAGATPTNDQTIQAVTPSIALSDASPSAGTINQNSTNNILRSVQLVVTNTAATLTGVTFTTAGTYQISDLQANGFKFWYNTANNLSGATQLGAAQSIVTSGNNISVSGLSQSVTVGTRYILVTADVAYNANTSNNISISSTAFSNISFVTGTKTGTDPVGSGNTQSFGNVTPAIAITQLGPSANTLVFPTTNSILYQLSFAVTANSTDFNSIAVTTAGTYQVSDFAANSFKLWYNTTNNFATAGQIGTSQAIVTSGSPVTFSSLTQNIITGTTGFIWITTDAAAGAVAGHTINITSTAFSNIVFSAGTKTGADPAAAGGIQTLTANPALTEVIFPQYAINGNTAGSRLQYVCRLTLSNLIPNATYRYTTAAGSAGNMFAINNTTGVDGYITGYTSSKSLGGTLFSGNEFVTTARYAELTTDASGNYTGWFSMVPTGNAVFNAGSTVTFSVALNNGAGGTTTATTLTSTNTITMIAPATGANGGQAIASTSHVGNENMVFLYDNTAGTGRPIYGTWTENDGITTGFTTWYETNPGSTTGAWGAYIPVALPNGIRRIEYKNTPDNALLYAQTDNDGNWNGTVNTVNPAGGTTPLVIPNNTYDDFTVGSNTTLTSSVNVYGTLTVNNGAVLDADGAANDKVFTLKSTSNAATARVATGAAAGGYITGNVTVERYIDNTNGGVAGRKWHLLSGVTTTTTQSIRDSWQDGGSVQGANPGYGTWITAAGSPAGYDGSSTSSSILKHDPATPAWVTPAATNTGALSDEQGYMLFVRGDRSADPNNTINNPTVLRATGNLKQGTQGAISILNSRPGYTLVGNPFASPIDLENILTTANLGQSFQVWDATQAGNYGVGQFRVVQKTGAGTYTATPSTGNDNSLRYIHSGQAFFLKTNGGGDASVVIAEANKASQLSVVNPIVQAAGNQQLYTELAVTNKGGNTETITDAVRVWYNAGFSAGTKDDLPKLGNFGENISSYREGKKFIVENRPMITNKDTIFLRSSNLVVNDYRFKINTFDFVQTGLTAFLVDSYLKTTTALNLGGSINNINFSVTADAASANPDRFMIVFAASKPQPATITLQAAQQNNQVAVDWKVSNQLPGTSYEVERSTDAVNFSKVNTQTATNAIDAGYNWLDANPALGDNYYRIRSIGTGGEATLSQPVKVTMGKGIASSLFVYPNPVVNKTVNLLFTNMDKGTYRLRVINTAGVTVSTLAVNHTGGNGIQNITLPNGITAGSYKLEITKPDNNRTSLSLIILQ